MLAELLALDPSATNRAAGIAAVRRVAGVQPSGDTVVEQRPGSVTISWPGSPTIVAVAGGGFDLGDVVVDGGAVGHRVDLLLGPDERREQRVRAVGTPLGE